MTSLNLINLLIIFQAFKRDSWIPFFYDSTSVTQMWCFPISSFRYIVKLDYPLKLWAAVFFKDKLIRNIAIWLGFCSQTSHMFDTNLCRRLALTVNRFILIENFIRSAYSDSSTISGFTCLKLLNCRYISVNFQLSTSLSLDSSVPESIDPQTAFIGFIFYRN